MAQSRCGIVCSECEGREEAKCTGCATMEKPFWGGDCAVKTCCEGRKLDHCGQCGQFPCEILRDMGKEQGYDSAEKIAQCRRWAEEEAAETVATMGMIGTL